MTIERFQVPSGTRAARALERTRRSASDELGGRTVWFAAALPDGRQSARRLAERLRSPDGATAAVGWIEASADEPLLDLAHVLEAMLSGRSDDRIAFGAEAREIYADGLHECPRGIVAGDIVVLHDPLTAGLAGAVRDRGAHAVWQVRLPARPTSPSAGAWSFVRDQAAPMDAYVVASRGDVERVSAVMPTADAVATKEIADLSDLAWSSMLADVVHGDRDEHVGGTVHARPAVAAH